MSEKISAQQSQQDTEVNVHELASIHNGYVKELAKLIWLSKSLMAMSNDFCNKCPDIGGLELLITGMTDSIQALNDKLDRYILKRISNTDIK